MRPAGRLLRGAKDRVVPLGRHAVKFLKTYLAKMRPLYTTENWAERCLFVGRFGAPLLEQVIQKMVRNFTRAAGVRKQVSPHTFRHTFATELVRNGAEITAVQRKLGHADLSVTHDARLREGRRHRGQEDPPARPSPGAG